MYINLYPPLPKKRAHIMLLLEQLQINDHVMKARKSFPNPDERMG